MQVVAENPKFPILYFAFEKLDNPSRPLYDEYI